MRVLHASFYVTGSVWTKEDGGARPAISNGQQLGAAQTSINNNGSHVALGLTDPRHAKGKK